MNRDYEKYVHSVALEFNLPDEVARKIIESPFQFMRDKIPKMIEDDDFKNFRLMNLGIFYTTDAIKKAIKDGDKQQILSRGISEAQDAQDRRGEYPGSSSETNSVEQNFDGL
jgi:hypothetical protein